MDIFSLWENIFINLGTTPPSQEENPYRTMLPQEILARWPSQDGLSLIIQEFGMHPELILPFIESVKPAILTIKHESASEVGLSIYFLIERLVKCSSSQERATLVDNLLRDFAPEAYQQRMELASELDDFEDPRVNYSIQLTDTYYECLKLNQDIPVIEPISSHSESSDSGTFVGLGKRKKRSRRKRTKRAVWHEDPAINVSSSFIDQSVTPITVDDCDYESRGTQVLLSDFVTGYVTRSSYTAAKLNAPRYLSQEALIELERRQWPSGYLQQLYRSSATFIHTQTSEPDLSQPHGPGLYPRRYRPRWRTKLVSGLVKLLMDMDSGRPPESLVMREVSQPLRRFWDYLI